jgi:YVTN family beta-propeller protein
MTRSPRLRHHLLPGLCAVALLAAACGDDADGAGADDAESASGGATTTVAPDPTTPHDLAGTTDPTATTVAPEPTSAVPDLLAGMPPVLDAANVYSETVAGKPSAAHPEARSLVYVPTNRSGDVTVIDPETFEVLATHHLGELVQHVVPSWDMQILYANVSAHNVLVPFDPITAEPGEPIRVDAPYNLYFTPDGSRAVVMAERRNRIDYYDPATWERVHSVDVPCRGPNHADWTIDGKSFVVTCEFSGQMLRVDTASGDVAGVIDLGSGARPQDVRLGPDGATFFIADLNAGGVRLLDARTFEVAGLIETGAGPHSVYPSRDATRLYVANRDGGSVAVVDPATNQVVDRWEIPGGGSPDMGGVSADGSTLWLSGRHHDEVYAFDTASGELRARIPVPGEPHGIAVFPQPGRYSLGHTGNYR